MRIIVTKVFNFDHRPDQPFCTTLKPSEDFQTVKKVVGDAAIAAGKAHLYKQPKPEKETNGETSNPEI